MSQVTSSRGTRDRRSLADLEENASRRMGPGIAGHVRGPRFCGQAARLPPVTSGSIRVVWSVPLGQSVLTAPLPREQLRCQRPFLWGIAQGRTGHLTSAG